MDRDIRPQVDPMRHPDARPYMPTPQQYIDSAKAQAPQSGPAPQPIKLPKRRRSFGFKRAILSIFLLLILAAVAYAGYLVSIVAKISTNSWQVAGLSADSSGRTNMLVLGVGDPGHAGENLSDTMMVVSLDSATHRISEFSIPRDLRVQIPGYGYSKINAANAYGGEVLAEHVVSNTLNTQIDYYVQTDFTGLRDIVDAVGGLDVSVTSRLVDTEYPCDNNQYAVCGLDIEPGLQHMDGARVLQYVRCRKGTCGNDFGRAARQQQIISLLKPKVLDPSLLLHPNKLTQLTTAIQKSLKTNLGLVELLEVANRFRTDYANQPATFVLSTAPGGLLKGDPAGSSDLLPIGGDYSAIADKFKNLFTTPTTNTVP
jgi:LCP family protein required for cell wall assembly